MRSLSSRSPNPISRKQLEELYVEERLSMAEVAERLSCSISKVVYWMDQYGIVRRTRDEASCLKHNPAGDPFTIKEPVTADDRELFDLGVGLYIGEGTKDRQQVRLSNTDPRVIRAFLRFLREICGVNDSKIHAWLNIYDDVELSEAQAYWQEVTGLPDSQFFKPTVRPNRGGTYLDKSHYGTLTVGISSTKLSSRIRQWSEETLKKFST